jgi:hypothetical protein
MLKIIVSVFIGALLSAILYEYFDLRFLKNGNPIATILLSLFVYIEIIAVGNFIKIRKRKLEFRRNIKQGEL